MLFNVRRTILALAALAVLAVPAGAASGGAPRVEAALAAKAPEGGALMRVARRDGLVPVIVELRPQPLSGGRAAARGDLALQLSAGQAIDRFVATRKRGFRTRSSVRLRGFKRMDYLPVVAFQATPSDLAAMARDPQVRRIHRDRLVRPTLAESVPLIGTPKVTEAGETGSDAIVVVLDTGVESSHPFLSGKVIDEACFSTTSAYPSQSLCPGGGNVETGPGTGDACSVASYGSACDHGTHVAGIAAGFEDGASPEQGVAAGASIVGVQVFSWFPGDSAVLSYTSDQLKALEWVYSRRNAYPGKKIAAVNMSLGGGRYKSSCTDSPLKTIIGKLRSAGILTVIASGNNGYSDSMASPACTPGAVSVASTTKDDVRSSFSNNSPITTLYAPGSGIVSSISGGAMATKSGTSMATPHVAGAVAVLRSAFPSATADEIVTALTATGKLVTAPSARGGKLPRIDLSAAFQRLGGTVETDLQVSSNAAVEIERVGNDLSATSFAVTVSAAEGSVPWRLTGIPSWLKASARSGTATTTGKVVTFKVVAPKRQSGDLSTTLVFSETSGNKTTIDVPVTIVWVAQELSLTPGDPVTIANTNSLRALPASFDVTLASNVGNAPWRIQRLPNWLKASQKTGTATPSGTTITLTPLPSKARKTASADIVFAMTGGSRHSVTLPVTMDFVNQRLSAEPLTDTLVAQSNGAASPAIVQIKIATNGDESGWKVTGTPYWLTPSATDGTTDEDGTTLSFTVSPQVSLRSVKSAKLRFYLTGLKRPDTEVLVRLQPPS